MRKLLFLLALGLLASCSPELSSKFLSDVWYVEQDTCVTYSFIGKKTLYITNDVEGEQYEYKLIEDTLVFYPVFEEELYGDTTFSDTLTLKLISDNKLEVNYHNMSFNLLRQRKY